MKITLLLTALFLGVVDIIAQNPVGFDAKCDKYITGSIPLSYPAELYSIIRNPGIAVLDAREKNEYEISHLQKAIYVGFDKFDKDCMKLVSKTDSIYIYCSIGYRSEKIGEKLVALGYKHVFNLYGGIFNWTNSGYKIVDANNNPTTNIHGYNTEWSKMLNNTKCSIKLNK